VNYNNPELIFTKVPTAKVGWCSPSNIALIKYWGKSGEQIPSNASISFTLSKSQTETVVKFSPTQGEQSNINFYFDGIPNKKFAEKISVYFNKIIDIFPFIKQLDFSIYSKNTFPHSAGIASSASGMSALALALCDIENQYFNTFATKEEFFQKASFIARLGSGSACRSIYGGLVSWGKIEEFKNTSDLFGNQVSDDINPIFKDYHDSILIVDSGEKKVSSTIGHNLMKSNPFSQSRFQQASDNMKLLKDALKSGDLDEFNRIVELEALTLHAMMMTSSPYYLLMKPNTVALIEKIWEFRNSTKVPVCFTLDAGPNIHLLYPHKHKNEVQSFVSSTLSELIVGDIIHDFIGIGPEKLEL